MSLRDKIIKSPISNFNKAIDVRVYSHLVHFPVQFFDWLTNTRAVNKNIKTTDLLNQRGNAGKIFIAGHIKTLRFDLSRIFGFYLLKQLASSAGDANNISFFGI